MSRIKDGVVSFKRRGGQRYSPSEVVEVDSIPAFIWQTIQQLFATDLVTQRITANTYSTIGTLECS